jgi:hypothetical protein
MLTIKIKENFERENGVSFHELSKTPSLIKKVFPKKKSVGIHVSSSIGRGYPFFGKTIDVKEKEAECISNLQKW